MARDWESWLRSAARPASDTEEAERDRTVERIRRAISRSPELPSSVRVYAKGSYANNTNVRRDSDVDIAVEWTSVAYVDTVAGTSGMDPATLGYNPVAFDITPDDFRSRVERALVGEFTTLLVNTSGDKAIDVLAGYNTLDADVVPCFQLHRYDAPGFYHQGHRLFPKSGGHIDNFPLQSYQKGVAKNQATGGRYKDIVRALKRLEGELVATGTLPSEYPSYLVECLVYNVPNSAFGQVRLLDDLRSVLALLWGGSRDQSVHQTWLEVNELLYLFRGHPKRSTADAHQLINAAWDMVGTKD